MACPGKSKHCLSSISGGGRTKRVLVCMNLENTCCSDTFLKYIFIEKKNGRKILRCRAFFPL